MAYSNEMVQKIIKLQKNEIIGYHIYRQLSKFTKDEKNSRILRYIADSERSHCESLEGFSKQKVEVSQFQIKLAIWLVTMAVRIFGLTFTLKFFERKERASTDIEYLVMNAPEIAAFIEDEEKHELLLLKMINEERLKYMGSIVLGLNDALVELTGALAGFTLSIQNSRTIALMGLITGISASFSMAASEYLSTKTEEVEDIDAKKASIYTGIAYVFTVIFLILPFLLISNYIISLGITILIAITIIALFNYYISVAKEGNFRRRFFEMATISIGVAAISFVIGYLVNTFIGVDI